MADMLPYGSPYGSLFPTLQPEAEDEQSLTRRLLGYGGSALSWLGGMLNKPGRVVRGAIGGEPSELLNIIPFSDYMGITDPEREVTGRKLLGLGARQGQGLNLQDLPTDVLGFCAEVLSDPLTWLSFGGSAVGRGGQIAKKIGMMPKGGLARTAEEAALLGVKEGEYAGSALQRMTKTLGGQLEGALPELLQKAEIAAAPYGGLTPKIMEQPLGGMFGFGPFAGFRDPMFAFGTGPVSQAIAKGTGQAADWLRYTAPVRLGAQLFHKPALDASSEVVQRAGPGIQESQRAVETAARGRVRDIIKPIQEAGLLDEPTMRAVGEGIKPVGEVFDAEVANAIQGMWNEQNAIHNEALDIGRDVKHLTEGQREPGAKIGPMGEQFAEGDPSEFVHRIEPQGIGRTDVATSPLGVSTIPSDMMSAITGGIDRLTGGVPSASEQYAWKLNPAARVLDVGEQIADVGVRENLVKAAKRMGYDAIRIGGDSPLAEHLLLTENAATPVSRAIKPPAIGEEVIRQYGAHRETSLLPEPTRGFSRAEKFEQFDPSAMARAEKFQNVLGGSLGVPQMIQDVGRPLTGHGLPEGAARLTAPQAAQRIRENFLRWEPSDEAEMFRLSDKLKQPYVDPLAKQADQAAFDALNGMWGQSEKLAGWMQNLDPKYFSGPFWNNFFDDYAKGTVRSRLVNNFFRKAHDVLSDVATVGQKAADDVPLPEALTEMGLTKNIGEGTKLERGALRQQMDRLEAAGKLPRTAALDLSPAEYRRAVEVNERLTAGQYADEAERAVDERFATALARRTAMKEAVDLKNFYVPREVVDNLKNSNELMALPESTGKVVKLIDSFTNLFKGMVYPFWPSARFRDFTTGVYQNWVNGTVKPNRWSYAKDLLAGKPVEQLTQMPIFKGKSVEEANDAMQRIIYQHKMLGRGAATQAGEVTGEAALHAASRLAEEMPDITPQTIGRALSPLATLKPQAWNPLKMAGVGDVAEDIFAPGIAGRRVASLSDSTNRVASLVDQMFKGVAPEIAAAKANAIHLEYDQLTNFERKVMRRLIPFYSYQRRTLPVVFENLTERPGGLMGQSVMTAEKMRDPTAPPQVQRGIAIPVGGAVEGQQRYLSGLDLPHESILNLVQGGPTVYGGVRNTLQQIMSQMNPLAKLPVELATGKQLFSGRNLEDLYGPMRRMGLETNPLAEQLLFNSPLARVASTAMQVSDPRKYNLGLPINLLTGARVTDVDLERARNEMIRKTIEEQLQPSPNIRRFSRVFAPKELAPNLTPEQAAMLQLYNQTLQTRQATP